MVASYPRLCHVSAMDDIGLSSLEERLKIRIDQERDSDSCRSREES